MKTILFSSIVSSTETFNLSLNLQIYFARMKSPRGDEKLRRFLFMLVFYASFNKVLPWIFVWLIKSQNKLRSGKCFELSVIQQAT